MQNKFPTNFAQIAQPFFQATIRKLLHLAVSSTLVSIAWSGTPEKPGHDIVVYGGTPAGIVAAVQAKKMGKSVVIIEPSNRLGGMASGGLGHTDIGNKTAIGGLAREFFKAVKAHYANPAAWTWQTAPSDPAAAWSRTGKSEETMWSFEPHVALDIFNDWVKREGIEVVYKERLDRRAGVKTADGRIASIAMESGRVFPGKMFIDATYEGDLMAAAGVSYTVGRESNSQYGETREGIQPAASVTHQISPHVDPYVTPGDKASGLLPFIRADGPGGEGEGDKGIQAYCYRMCLTNVPENRIPFEKPEGYNEQWYELLFRDLAAQNPVVIPWINAKIPNAKTDANNRRGVSTDFIGQNYDYPEASYAGRDEIVARHLLYQKGLMWTLANHPRIPKEVRDAVSQWGSCKDEFQDTGGWPGQIYVREARRMTGDYVMTQNNCQGLRVAEDPVGLAAYPMDSHSVQRYVDKDGFVLNEGCLQLKGFHPYPVSYRSIVPKEKECRNLLVPVCLSASHIAYGSIRMEPVFMLLGQSAATAAALAIDEGTAVQKVDMNKLRQRLLDDGQVLQWTPAPAGEKQGGSEKKAGR